MKKALYILGLVLATIALVFFISPSKLNREQTKQTSGIVTAVYASDTKDVIFKISGSKVSFCIKKHLKKSLDLNELKEKLVGKKVTIWYNDCWTPLDPGSKKQIAELSFDDGLLYSELAK